MTFEAWWELLRWAAFPALGLLVWWIRDIQARQRHAAERLYEKIDAEARARHEETEACRREHREAVRVLHADLNTWKMDATNRFATAATMDRGFEKLENAIIALGTRMERWIEGQHRPPGGAA